MKQTFNIIGMSCINCSNSIKHTLSKTKGVLFVDVNFGSNIMIIEYEENIISEKEIIKIVKKLGFKATNTNSNELENSIKKRKKEIII